MDHQGHYSSGNQQQHRQYSNEGQPRAETASSSTSSSSTAQHMPYLRNNDYRKFLQMAAHQEPITFKDLASVRSFKINSEREYQMVVLLAHTLNEEMTKYRLAKTPPELLDALEHAFSSRSARPPSAQTKANEQW